MTYTNNILLFIDEEFFKTFINNNSSHEAVNTQEVNNSMINETYQTDKYGMIYTHNNVNYKIIETNEIHVKLQNGNIL